jgi:MFS family permease
MTASTEKRDRRWYVLLTVGIGTFLSSLNTSITNTVLPVIQRSLGLTLSQSEWIVLIYLLVLTLFLLPVGKLSDLIGHKLLFLCGFALFALSAALCGLSRNYLSLLSGRALLAVAGSMILAVGPALLSATFPPAQLGRVLGLQAIMTYIGLSLGPALGGWFTEWWGWPVIFFLTIPFSLLGLAAGIWAIPEIASNRRKPFDLKGFFFFIIGMTACTLLLNLNVITGNRASIGIMLLLLFALSAWEFVRVEQKQPEPMLDLRLFRIRNIGFGALGAALNYLCFFLALFLLPFYFDHVLKYSAAAIGSLMTITPLVMTVSAPISGALSDRTGPRLLTNVGNGFQHLGPPLIRIHGKDAVFGGAPYCSHPWADTCGVGDRHLCRPQQLRHIGSGSPGETRRGIGNIGHVPIHRHDGRNHPWRLIVRTVAGLPCGFGVQHQIRLSRGVSAGDAGRGFVRLHGHNLHACHGGQKSGKTRNIGRQTFVQS